MSLITTVGNGPNTDPTYHAYGKTWKNLMPIAQGGNGLGAHNAGVGSKATDPGPRLV